MRRYRWSSCGKASWLARFSGRGEVGERRIDPDCSAMRQSAGRTMSSRGQGGGVGQMRWGICRVLGGHREAL